MSQSSSEPPKEIEPLQQPDVCQDDAPVSNATQASSEALKKWNTEVMAHMKRLSSDEDYRLEISKKLS